MTKYESISTEMRKRIKDGYYPVDSPIPDEHSLAKEFGCSRMTMKRALDILVAEGLLYRKRGHGTFIIQTFNGDQTLNVISDESIGFSNLVKGKKVNSQVIELNIDFPSPEVADHLAIDVETPVYHIIRLRMVEDEPYVIEETYMPSNLIPGINEKVLTSSIYSYIQDTLELKIGGAHRKIRACKSNELDQMYMGCKADDPVLEVEQVGYLNNGVPFEYSFSRHRYDKFVFTSVTVKK
ncbi:MAG: GntR family transcriptional regulator [Bacillus sp. (in: firmicutes)]